MKHLFTLSLLATMSLYAQTVTHHQDHRGRMWQIHRFHRPVQDSVVAYVYGKPQRSDRALIQLTKQGRAYQALYFIKARRREPKYWSYFPQKNH